MHQHTKGLLNSNPVVRLTLFVTVISMIGILNSCNNKGKAVISAADSLSVTKAYLLTKVDKMYKLKFTIAQQQAIFRSNDVKQVQFVMKDYGNSTWGLTAYGANNEGRRITEGLDLERLMNEPLVTNSQYLNRPALQVWNRGDLKALLNLPTRGQDVPVGAAEYRDLLFTPTQVAYDGTANDMYYIITFFPNIVLLNSKDAPLAGQQGNSNPSPPANSVCGTGCDDATY
jgi:hypothetical protein